MKFLLLNLINSNFVYLSSQFIIFIKNKFDKQFINKELKMSILKKKIAHAQRIHFGIDLEKNPFLSETSDTKLVLLSHKNDPLDTKSQNNSTNQSTPKRGKEIREGTCQNIVKNYSRAFINFALSPLSLPYLNSILSEEGLSLEAFHSYVSNRRGKINCIKNLRAALLIKTNDSDKTAASKKVFRRISEVFLKFFCVNWLFDSKIENKVIHLNYRFKILRRIRKPEYFTYLEEMNFK